MQQKLAEIETSFAKELTDFDFSSLETNPRLAHIILKQEEYSMALTLSLYSLNLCNHSIPLCI